MTKVFDTSGRTVPIYDTGGRALFGGVMQPGPGPDPDPTPAVIGDPEYDYAADLAAYPAVAGVVDAHPYAPMVYAPTPVPAGYGLSVCHPAVTDTGPEGWNGYRWWKADTPYPPDAKEDPIVLRSNDRINWELSPGENPLDYNREDEGYPGAFNSDPETIFDPDTSTLYVLWRWYGNADTGVIYRARSSTDGRTWTPVQDVSIPTRGQSPAWMRRPDGKWILYTLNPYVRHEADHPLGPYTNPTVAYLSNARHGDIVLCRGIYMAIGTASAGGGPAYASASRDGIRWSSPVEVPAVGGWTTGHYRPTMSPSNSEGYMDVWSGVFGGKHYNVTGYTRVPLTVWTSLV